MTLTLPHAAKSRAHEPTQALSKVWAYTIFTVSNVFSHFTIPLKLKTNASGFSQNSKASKGNIGQTISQPAGA